jgi:hypothetical protein
MFAIHISRASNARVIAPCYIAIVVSNVALLAVALAIFASGPPATTCVNSKSNNDGKLVTNYIILAVAITRLLSIILATIINANTAEETPVVAIAISRRRRRQRTLRQHDVDRLVSFEFQPSEPNHVAFDQCTICLDDYKRGDQLVRLHNCTHVFHLSCVSKWLITSKNECPCCRAVAVNIVPSVEVFIDVN